MIKRLIVITTVFLLSVASWAAITDPNTAANIRDIAALKTAVSLAGTVKSITATPPLTGGTITVSGSIGLGPVPFKIMSSALRSGLGTAAFKNIPATGNASSSQVVYGTDTRLTDSRTASDVYAWAKTPAKPTYTYSEVGADVAGAAAAITSISGNAATASALAANGTNCSAGNYAQGVDASGNAEGCGVPAGTYSLPTATTSVLGGVKVDGTTITIASGIISGAPAYTLPTATASVLGGVKPDGTSILNTAGAISATAASIGAAATAQTMYIGTTSHAINRASAAEGLAGITGLTPGADFVMTQNSVAAVTSVETGALVNTLYLKAGNVGIGTTSPLTPLQVVGNGSFSGSVSGTSFRNSGVGTFQLWASIGQMEFSGFTSGLNTAFYFQPDSANVKTSGSWNAVKIGTSFNQTSGGAANTDFLISRSETAVGSGNQLLIDAQVNSTSKFNITNIGQGYFAGSVGIGTTAPSGKFDVHGSGTTTGVNVQFADSGGTGKFTVLDNGNTSIVGPFLINTVGNGISLKEGSNAKMGTGILVGGTATISTTAVATTSRIFLTDTGGGVFANIGSLSVGTVTSATSFIVNSSNVLDTSNFNWIIFDPA